MKKMVGCTQPITEDLGNMRFASDYTDKYNPIPICRHMKIKNGVVNLLEGEWYRCYANV